MLEFLSVKIMFTSNIVKLIMVGAFCELILTDLLPKAWGWRRKEETFFTNIQIICSGRQGRWEIELGLCFLSRSIYNFNKWGTLQYHMIIFGFLLSWLRWRFHPYRPVNLSWAATFDCSFPFVIFISCFCLQRLWTHPFYLILCASWNQTLIITQLLLHIINQRAVFYPSWLPTAGSSLEEDAQPGPEQHDTGRVRSSCSPLSGSFLCEQCHRVCNCRASLPRYHLLSSSALSAISAAVTLPLPSVSAHKMPFKTKKSA